MTRDELILNNLGLVGSCASRFTGKGVDYDDLYSAGCVGLIKAADRFDENLGFAKGNNLGFRYAKYDLNAVLWHDEPVYVKISFNECSGVVWVGQLLTDDEGKVYMERSAYVHGDEPGNKEAELHVGSTFATPSGTSFCYPLGEYMTTILSGLEEPEE